MNKLFKVDREANALFIKETRALRIKYAEKGMDITCRTIPYYARLHVQRVLTNTLLLQGLPSLAFLS